MRVLFTQKLFLIIIFLAATSTITLGQRRKGKYEGGVNTGAIGRKVASYFYNSTKYHLPESGAGLVSYSGSFGTSTYYGDLCQHYSCMVFRPNIGVQHYYRLGYHFNVKTELNYYRLESKDYYSTTRDLGFRSGNVEMYTSLMYDVLAFQKRYKKRAPINPYVFAGVGFTTFNPHGEYKGKWYALEPMHLEGHGYSRVTGILPFGMGIRIKYIRGFDFMVEAGYRKTFTDYLDNVSSKSYLPPSDFGGNAAAQYLSCPTCATSPNNIHFQRGDPSKKDGYFIFQAKVVYTPKMRYVSIPRYRHKVGTRSGI